MLFTFKIWRYICLLTLAFILGCADGSEPDGTGEALLHTGTICGNDQREPSDLPEIGRLRMGKYVCSGTLIGRSCFITAGHCLAARGKKYVEFNTPRSINGRPASARSVDQYTIKRKIRSRNRGKGNDYAVLMLDRNSQTGKWPGDIQGHLDVEMAVPGTGRELVISGYGIDKGDALNSYAQQTHSNVLDYIIGSRLYYKVDTMGGNSGSSVVDKETGKVIGVHTHGGCDADSGFNAGTSIARNKYFRRAIQKCLDREQRL